MINSNRGFSLIEVLISVSLFVLFFYISSLFITGYISNYLSIYKDLSSVNEILFALNSIEGNICISDKLLYEPDYNSNESTLALGYFDEGIFKKVSYSLYQNKIRKKMENIAYLTTNDSNISELKFYYKNKLISFVLKVLYGNYISSINGKAVIPNKL